MKKSALLKECAHHEIALLGVPEMYRVKLAFLAGFRFAVEPPCQKILRRYQDTQEKPKEFYEAQACMQQIRTAEDEIYDDIRRALGNQAANLFILSTRKLHTFQEFDAQWAASVNERMHYARVQQATQQAALAVPAPAKSPQVAASTEATPATAEPQQTEAKPAPAAKGSDDCDCPACTLRKFFSEYLNQRKSQSAA